VTCTLLGIKTKLPQQPKGGWKGTRNFQVLKKLKNILFFFLLVLLEVARKISMIFYSRPEDFYLSYVLYAETGNKKVL
jgi:hypothetical protein